MYVFKASLLRFMTIIVLKLGLSPCKTEQPLPGMKLQEKKIKDDNHRGNLLRKNPIKKRVY